MTFSHISKQHDLRSLGIDQQGALMAFFVSTDVLIRLGEPRAAWKLYRLAVEQFPVVGVPVTEAQLVAYSKDESDEL